MAAWEASTSRSAILEGVKTSQRACSRGRAARPANPVSPGAGRGPSARPLANVLVGENGSAPRHRRESRSRACVPHNGQRTREARSRKRVSRRDGPSPSCRGFRPPHERGVRSLETGAAAHAPHRRVRSPCATRIDELFEDDLARDGLRDLQHGREIQLLDRRADRGARVGGRALPPSGAGTARRAAAPCRRRPIAR